MRARRTNPRLRSARRRGCPASGGRRRRHPRALCSAARRATPTRLEVAQRLGGQALVEDDLDRSPLLARQAVAIDDSPRILAPLLAAGHRCAAPSRCLDHGMGLDDVLLGGAHGQLDGLDYPRRWPDGAFACLISSSTRRPSSSSATCSMIDWVQSIAFSRMDRARPAAGAGSSFSRFRCVHAGGNLAQVRSGMGRARLQFHAGRLVVVVAPFQARSIDAPHATMLHRRGW